MVVMQKKRDAGQGVRYSIVKTGLQDERHVEILDGLQDNAIVLLPDTTFVLPKKNTGANPFVPQRSRMKP
jgi:macrolide-specific efflux system membrane fusion protein